MVVKDVGERERLEFGGEIKVDGSDKSRYRITLAITTLAIANLVPELVHNSDNSLYI